ncbi:DNA methyltransferase [Vibrio splendidus]|uniref:DNA methyltransferase n=1 Tax=Vibrio splendidus TaxID=29497 RepID=UPI0007F97E1E|nr:DNA methyltransferase [Vibrio splendidus]OBT26959.1 DNA methylase [Vibrio splendidus]
MKQESLLSTNLENTATSVECLGMTFESEEARRSHFTELLRQKLNDPDYKSIEGFPLGTNEAILALSDPPYYTACPNPWLSELMSEWEISKEEHGAYHREPYASDVKESKNDAIYNAHSYHTKVPHKAIMRYILHYTNPGDVVHDCFCGTGMTGVAAKLCGSKEAVESLGYLVNELGDILEKSDGESNPQWKIFSKLGERKAILSDLSPAATFIASNYNKPNEPLYFNEQAKQLVGLLEQEFGWMYRTKHSDGQIGTINYTVWSDVFECPTCNEEIIFWDSAVDVNNGVVRDSFPCNGCSTNLTKRAMSRAKVSFYDNQLKEVIAQTKSVPVRINYSIPGERRSFDKKPDKSDLELIHKISQMDFDSWYPTDPIVDGDKTPEATRQGYKSIDHLFTQRNLHVFSSAWRLAPYSLKWAVTGSIQRGSKQHQIAISRIGGPKAGVGGATAGHRRGTLYIPSNQVEMSVILLIRERLNQISKIVSSGNYSNLIQIRSATSNGVPENSLDYVFIDPPFGSNIMYSELSQIWEAWLKVQTNNKEEAIENKTQNKSVDRYRQLMTQSFRNVYKSLKPGRWATIEFSNTKASVWNTIQTSISEAGLVIASVSALDKGRGGLNSIVGVTAVKQDLIISAYKPMININKEVSLADSKYVWDFVDQHLNMLPVVKVVGNTMMPIVERDPRVLYDRLVSYSVQNSIAVSMSSREFQLSLSRKYVQRDNMYFLASQSSKYDSYRAKLGVPKQLSMFVDDEASAIEWMRKELKDKPKTYSEIHPLFLSELSGWKKNELELELFTLLEQNFLKYDGKDEVPSQVHTYLSTNFKDMRGLDKSDPKLVAKAKDRWYVPDPNKAADLDKIRLRALLKEFETYKEVKKKIKQPRAEALRAGFNTAWEAQDFQTILDISAKIPPVVLQEDEKLLMFYDNALTLTSGEDDEW